MWEDNRGGIFSLEEKLLWTCILVRIDKNILIHLFLTNEQLFTSQDVNWWTWRGFLWCFYQLFGLWFWRHPFTTEHPLVSKWWYITFNQICSDEEVHFQQIFLFFNCNKVRAQIQDITLLMVTDVTLPTLMVLNWTFYYLYYYQFITIHARWQKGKWQH